jgi:adenosylmethionine-8-amino-7-oxononanoate aminotransferase
VVPDLLTIAKGLGGGYQPIGAVLAQRAIVDRLLPGSGLFQHGHTYIGHAVACAAALAVQQVIGATACWPPCSSGRRACAAAAACLWQHPHVGDVRGRGLFWGLELVADRAARRRSTRAEAACPHPAQAMARGLMVYPMGGTLDGRLGDHVLLAPPFIVSEDDLDPSSSAWRRPSTPRSRNQGLDNCLPAPARPGGLSAPDPLCIGPPTVRP